MRRYEMLEMPGAEVLDVWERWSEISSIVMVKVGRGGRGGGSVVRDVSHLGGEGGKKTERKRAACS